eukprot:5026492-Prymnesium_polylepis.1
MVVFGAVFNAVSVLRSRWARATRRWIGTKRATAALYESLSIATARTHAQRCCGDRNSRRLEFPIDFSSRFNRFRCVSSDIKS